MRLLVTGSAGFIGLRLLQHLRAQGYMAFGVDDFSRHGNGSEHKETNKLSEYLDITNFQAIHDYIYDMEFDGVFHLAGQTAVTTSIKFPRADFSVNAHGTLNILEAARSSHTKPFVVVASTNKVYGHAHTSGVLVDETCPLSGESPYGVSKLTADQLALDWHRTYGLRSASLRMSCIYGDHQYSSEDQGWVSHLIRSVVQSKPITIYGDGTQTRDICYVQDAVEVWSKFAEIGRLGNTHHHPAWGQAFNVGGGPTNTLSVSELLLILHDQYGYEPMISWGSERVADQHIYISDVSKAQRMLGWHPTTGKLEGIKKLVEWVKCSG